MDAIEKIKSRIQDVSTLKEMLQEYMLQRNVDMHQNLISFDISEINDTPFNLFEFSNIGIRVWKKNVENAISGKERSEYKMTDNAFARMCFLDALNANKRAIIQSMISKMREEIKVDYDGLWMQMHELGNSMTKNIDKYLCTEEKEIVTKVLTNKYTENEEMSDKNEILEKG